MNKREAFEERTLQQKILVKKAIRIIKYYPEAKHESTLWNRAMRVLILIASIESIQAEKRVIIAQPEL